MANAFTIVTNFTEWLNTNPNYKFGKPSEIPNLVERIRSNISGMDDRSIINCAIEYTIEGPGPYYSGEFSEFEGVLRQMYYARNDKSDTTEMIRKSKLFCDTVRYVYEENKPAYTFMFNTSQKPNLERGSVF